MDPQLDRLRLRPLTGSVPSLRPAAAVVATTGLWVAVVAAAYALLVANSVGGETDGTVVARWEFLGAELVGVASLLAAGLLVAWLTLDVTASALGRLEPAVDVPVETATSLQEVVGDGLLFGARVPVVQYVDATESFWLPALVAASVGFTAVLLAWVAIAAVFDVLAGVAVVGYERSFEAALAVAGWGFLPAAVGLLADLLFVAASYAGATAGPEQASWYTFRVQYDALLTLRIPAGVAIAGWQTVVWGDGLAAARAEPLVENPRSVYVVAGVVAGTLWLLRWVT